MNTEKIFFPELSYSLVGICFSTHNELGRYAREKQYGDVIASKLKDAKISFEREYRIGSSGNIVDFLIDGKIILELKAKRIILKEDYYQMQRYLQEAGLRLGLLVNFRSEYLKPARIVRIDSPSTS